MNPLIKARYSLLDLAAFAFIAGMMKLSLWYILLTVPWAAIVAAINITSNEQRKIS